MPEEQFPYNIIFSEIGTVNTLHSTKLNWSIQCAREETILSSPLITDVWIGSIQACINNRDRHTPWFSLIWTVQCNQLHCCHLPEESIASGKYAPVTEMHHVNIQPKL